MKKNRVIDLVYGGEFGRINRNSQQNDIKNQTGKIFSALNPQRL